MPKETIYGYSSEDAPKRVDVAWGRDTHAQMATLTYEGLGIRTIDPESPDGLWVDLDRRSINSLIRTLRKARDQAFGVVE